MKKTIIICSLFLFSLATNAQQNQSQITDCNVFHQKPNSPLWASGTKKFCSNDGSWYIEVTIVHDEVTIKTYAGINNTYIADKVHPASLDKGKIVDNVIYTTRNSKRLKNEYKYLNGVFYMLNNEDDYNPYGECSTSYKPNSSTIDNYESTFDLTESQLRNTMLVWDYHLKTYNKIGTERQYVYVANSNPNQNLFFSYYQNNKVGLMSVYPSDEKSYEEFIAELKSNPDFKYISGVDSYSKFEKNRTITFYPHKEVPSSIMITIDYVHIHH